MSYFKSKYLIKYIKKYIKEIPLESGETKEKIIRALLMNNPNIKKAILTDDPSSAGKATWMAKFLKYVSTEDKWRALLICLRDEWPDQKENIQKFLDYDGFNFIKGDKQQEVYKQLVNCLLALVTPEKKGGEMGKFFESFKNLLKNIENEIYYFSEKTIEDKESYKSKRSEIIKDIDRSMKDSQKTEADIIDESKIEDYIKNRIALKQVKPVDPMWLWLAVAIILLIFYVINYYILMMKREVVPIATDAKAVGTVEILPNDSNIDY